MIVVSWGFATVVTWLVGFLIVGVVYWVYLKVRSFGRSSDGAFSTLLEHGYRNISVLTKDAEGRWAGTATKDGKTVSVAVDNKQRIIAK